MEGKPSIITEAKYWC